MVQEIQQQKATLTKQREDYVKKALVLRRELDELKRQKHELGSDDRSEKDLKYVLKENERLQDEITGKLKAILNVVEMLSSIIKDGKKIYDLEAELEKQIQRTKEESLQKNEKSTKMYSPKKEEEINKDQKFCYVYYDTGLHWCRACDKFPETAKEFLQHLHSPHHQDRAKEQEVDTTPWHKLPVEPLLASFEDAPKKRIPIKGLQFFISAPSWYCKLCDFWIGDLHCASHHLKSQVHFQNYENFVKQNPQWETEWLKDREKAMMRSEKNGEESSDSEKSRKKKRRHRKSSNESFLKEKKKKKRSKKKKQDSSDSSSSSSSSSDSSSDEEDENTETDKGKSIRVAMRNIQQVKSIMDEDMSKWSILEKLVHDVRKKDGEKKETKEREEELINHWVTVTHTLPDKEKNLLETLKDRMKAKQDLEKAKLLEYEIHRREKEREEQENYEKKRKAREEAERVEREKKRKEQEANKVLDKERSHVSAKLAEEKTVLDPDHPLLKQFQEALKEHYLYQINRLKNDIFECETDAKKKNEEGEQLGVQAYELQQTICRQQKTFEELISDVQTITAARQEQQLKLQEEKAKHKEATEKMIAMEKANLDLQNEINSVNLLIDQVSQWESKIESNLVVNLRIAEKTRKDRDKLSEEKRKQDAHIYKIMCTIWELEAQIETMNMQLNVKETEMEELEQTVALGNTNLEALQAEYRCLMHSWNSVVVAIGNRDRIVECLRSEEVKVQEKVKSTQTEIEQVKKLTKKEMNENQRLCMIKLKTEMDVNLCKQQIDEESLKYNEFANSIFEMQAVIEQTEKDIERVNEEIRHKEINLKQIMKDFVKISTKKYEMEKKFLEDLENQAANDTVAGNLYRHLNMMREKCKDLEIIMNEAENKQSQFASEMESQEYSNEENERALAEMEKQRVELATEADGIQEEKDKYKMLFRKKERHVTVLNHKLEKILEKLQTKIPVSPQELRISTLEKKIEDSQDKIKNLQIFWLREQNNLLNISKSRQEQIYQLNLLKKQHLLLRHKNLKITNELENYKKREQKIVQAINNLQNKATVLCDNLYKKRDKKSTLDKSNYYLQSQYDGKLKDAELECLEIEADIAEIEEEKIALSQHLIELNREVLEWEKKIKLARQTKNELRGTKGESSEIDNMKQEIQRMNIIYSQLKKAQEKLVKDLEHCVSRREAIFIVAEARQSRSKTNEEKIRINYMRKMDNIKNKIKQLETELKILEEKISHLTKEKLLLEEECETIKGDIQFSENYSKTLREEIEKRKTNRQLKFEMLVMMQRQLNVYRDLMVNRAPFVHTKKECLQSEYYHQKDINNRLCNVLQNLLSDFPNYNNELTRMYNTLKLSVYTRYSNCLELRTH
ncbi:hypothetical protein ABEB36_004849 [Hypothenemus hampei]|uniref:U1-type domain-containing protein n=1 Tax=Hypothenemus hampei TaxID=57062 RepID=A0ABD1EW25_HYPHA